MRTTDRLGVWHIDEQLGRERQGIAYRVYRDGDVETPCVLKQCRSTELKDITRFRIEVTTAHPGHLRVPRDRRDRDTPSHVLPSTGHAAAKKLGHLLGHAKAKRRL